MKIYLSNPALICCVGANARDFFKAVVSGDQSGIKKTECSLSGEDGKKSFFAGKIDSSLLKPTDSKFDSRFLQVLDTGLEQLKNSVEEAVKKYGKDRIAVCVGQCDNGSELSFKANKVLFETGNLPADYDLTAQGAQVPAMYISKKFGVTGPGLSFATACSSSATAIIKAKELIKAGIADAVIAGGADIVSDTVLLGFNSLEAIDTQKITDPFSKNRNGITLGEASAFFVLSRDDIENTKIILAGTGESCDASHMTAPLADGSGAESAIKAALKDAEIDAAEIDYVNMHGTGTHLNDSMEGKGINRVFGKYRVPVSTTKPVTGHTLGAAGALELAACFFAIKEQKLPVQVWDGEFDTEIPELNIVTKEKELKLTRPVKTCMSNSFAFGGANASLIIREE